MNKIVFTLEEDTLALGMAEGGASAREIAERLGKPVTTIYSRARQTWKIPLSSGRPNTKQVVLSALDDPENRKLSAVALAEKLGLSVHAVRNHAKKKDGFRFGDNRFWSDEAKEKLKELAESGLDYKSMASEFSTTVGAVKLKLRSMGVPYRRRRKWPPANLSFFQTPSLVRAYVVGFIFGDGYLYEADHSLRIVQSKGYGRDHLEAIWRHTGGCITKGSAPDSHVVTVRSVEMFDLLVSMGMTPGKKNRLTLPELSDNEFRSFLRGLYDADGSVWWRFKTPTARRPGMHAKITGSVKEFEDALAERVKNITGLEGSVATLRSEGHVWYDVVFGGNAYAFLAWLMPGHALCLGRKDFLWEALQNSLQSRGGQEGTFFRSSTDAALTYAARYKEEVFDDSTPSLIEDENLSVWRVRDSKEGYPSTPVGFSAFSPETAERVIKKWCSEGGLVVDPFHGWGTRAKAAHFLGCSYIGFDVSPTARAVALSCLDSCPDINLRDESGLELPGVSPSSADLVFTSPPFWSLENYDHAPQQLSDTKDFDTFTEMLATAIKASERVLKPGAFLVWQVGDFRRGGVLIPFTHVVTSLLDRTSLQPWDTVIETRLPGQYSGTNVKSVTKRRRLLRSHYTLLVYKKP